MYYLKRVKNQIKNDKLKLYNVSKSIYEKAKCKPLYYIVYFHFLISQYDLGSFLSIPI